LEKVRDVIAISAKYFKVGEEYQLFPIVFRGEEWVELEEEMEISAFYQNC
jgi:hypothetical protein